MKTTQQPVKSQPKSGAKVSDTIKEKLSKPANKSMRRWHNEVGAQTHAIASPDISGQGIPVETH